MKKVYYHLMLTGEAPEDRETRPHQRLLLFVHIRDGGTFSNVKPHQLLPFVHFPADEIN